MRILSIREPARADTNSRDARDALTAHRFFLRAALSAANIFSWIFVFQYFYVVSPDIGHAFARTALLYGLSQVVIALATPLSARFLRHGARRELAYATLLLGAAFVILGAALNGFWGSNMVWGVVVFAILIGLYRAFYWMPYEAETHEAGTPKGDIWREILIALIPAFVGFMVLGTGIAPSFLLFASAVVAVVSLTPMRAVQDVRELFPWGYRQTFAECMAPENRDVISQALFDGAYGAALIFIWPIAVFLIVGWSYALLGIVLSLTFLVGVLFRGTIRRLIRRLQLHQSPFVTALLVISPWILRLGVGTPLGIVLVDSYFYTTTPRRAGMDPMVFEQSGDAGFFVDRYTPVKEVGLALGRLAITAFAAFIALYVSLPVALIAAFLFAAFFSIWSAR